MIANPKKTYHLITGYPSSSIDRTTDIAKFEMNRTKIKRIHNVKSLRLSKDEKLKRNDHFKVLKRKVTAGLSSLKQLKNVSFPNLSKSHSLLQFDFRFIYGILITSSFYHIR